jgi:hypothetical protein
LGAFLPEFGQLNYTEQHCNPYTCSDTLLELAYRHKKQYMTGFSLRDALQMLVASQNTLLREYSLLGFKHAPNPFIQMYSL